jgi:hypothetical protein
MMTRTKNTARAIITGFLYFECLSLLGGSGWLGEDVGVAGDVIGSDD